MLSKELEEDMKNFINKYNGGATSNSTKRIGHITEDHVRYFLYITVLILNVALTIKHKDLMELNVSKILKGDCEPGFLNIIALSPMSPVSLPKTCQNYMVIKGAMKQVLSTNIIEIIYPLIIFFAGLIATGSYVKMNAELLNTIVSTIFNRVKTDGEKDKIKQKHIEGDVIEILNKMQANKVSVKMKEIDAVETLLALNQPKTLLSLNTNVSSKNKSSSRGKSKKNKNSSGGKSKKNKTKGGKSKKNKTRKSNTRKNKTKKN